MQGYLNDPEASGKSIDSGGWLRTGDIGYLEHGKFYIVDRRRSESLSTDFRGKVAD